ncbi:MAG TPA: response regulator [Vicinamibacterales bacterium]|nr:response regulator [Vicinamibacterales bacterium]
MTEDANILVVDDQPAKLLSYSAILNGLDANLVMAGSAREALEQLLKSEFAVVLVDVCMPELDGFELAAMIREHPRFRRTAIIFVSGVHLTDLDRLKGYEYGAVDYVPVPVVPEILRAKVNIFLDLYRKTRQLERLNRDLELRVAERTAELVDAARRKDEFLAMLAHELRNPLAAIRLAAQLVVFPDLPPPQLAKSAAVIHRQVEHLVRLIDDLVDVSRITRGLISLRREPTEISAVVAQAIESSRPLIDTKHHALTVTVPDDTLKVNGDAARLAQILANILNNAAKFTDPGGRVDLSVTRHGPEVVIRVTDTGIGISPEMLPNVFDLFTQIDRPLDRASTGLGIGLALVHRLVEMHGGRVSAHSAGSGAGAELVVYLPLYETSPAAVAPAPRPDRAAPELTPRRILVVDDNLDAAETLAVMLKLQGHQVEIAHDGLEALRLAPGFAPHVILLDLGMPNLNGYETANRIRGQAWGRDIALVALTGWGQPRDRKRTVEAGFDAHLVKPVDQTTLLKTLHEVAPQDMPRPPAAPDVRQAQREH